MQHSEENRFFKFVWRFNALAIAIATVLVSLIAAYAVYEQYRFRTRDRQTSEVLRPEGTAVSQDILKLGQPSPIRGTPWIAIPLVREQNANFSYYTKDYKGNQVNFYFADTTSGIGHWLLPNSKALIVNSLWLTVGEAADETTIGAIHEIIRQDSNGDGVISAKDKSAIAHTGVDGAGLRLLLEDVTNIIAMEQMPQQRFTIVYEQDGKSLAATYESQDARLISRTEIPSLK